ncbi:MAG TPA: hypothetical protein VL972_00560 [Solirubrobacteraceae bacterium]|nr:hypothetical protein [Solirubrobacteraceae bacterium]
MRRAGELLDRLIHGRAWIALVAFALIGIVTAQLGLLKLNAGIGRALEHEASLQRENAELSVEDSSFAAGDAIQLQAAHMGMEIIPAGALRFLSGRHAQRDAARAAAALDADAARAAEAATPSVTEAGAGSSEASASATQASSETSAVQAPETSAETPASSAPASSGEAGATAGAASAGESTQG